MLKRWILPILFLLAIGAAGAWLLLAPREGRREAAAPPAPVPPAPEAPRAPDPPFAVLYGGELGGRFWIPPCSLARLGGAYRVVDQIDSIRSASNVAMVVDTGDLVSAPGAAGALEYEAGLRFLEAAGPACVAVGERDLLLGLDRWRKAKTLVGPRVSILCANLRDDEGRAIAAAAAPVAIGRRRALVVAALSPSFEQGLRDGGAAVRLLPPAAAIREAVKAAGAPDFLVVLSHAPFAESKALLRDLPEADVVVSAHAPRESEDAFEVVDGRLLVNGGTGWQAVGSLSFGEPGPGEKRLRFLDGATRPVPLLPSPGPPVRTTIDEILGRARAAGVLEGSLREAASREKTARYVGPRACATCHPAAHQALQRPEVKHFRSLEPVRERNFLRVHQCLACHATAPGSSGGHVEPGDPQAAVTCEACHGPGAEHVATEGKARLADAKASCASCHIPEMDPSFRYEEEWPKVRHGK